MENGINNSMNHVFIYLSIYIYLYNIYIIKVFDFLLTSLELAT